MSMAEAIQLPRWQSHKIVEADKIIMVHGETPHLYGHWDLQCGETVQVKASLAHRVPDGVDPVGGYYVRYADGFESWSPAKAFEEGYTRLG